MNLDPSVLRDRSLTIGIHPLRIAVPDATVRPRPAFGISVRIDPAHTDLKSQSKPCRTEHRPDGSNVQSIQMFRRKSRALVCSGVATHSALLAVRDPGLVLWASGRPSPQCRSPAVPSKPNNARRLLGEHRRLNLARFRDSFDFIHLPSIPPFDGESRLHSNAAVIGTTPTPKGVSA